MAKVEQFIIKVGNNLNQTFISRFTGFIFSIHKLFISKKIYSFLVGWQLGGYLAVNVNILVVLSQQLPLSWLIEMYIFFKFNE